MSDLVIDCNHTLIMSYRNQLRPSRATSNQRFDGLLSEIGETCGQRIRCNTVEIWSDITADYECGKLGLTKKNLQFNN